MKHIKTQKQLNESSENLNISDFRQRFIQMVEDRINSLGRDMSYSKQGPEYYDKLRERIDELNDLLGEMKNTVAKEPSYQEKMKEKVAKAKAKTKK
jgi:DNA repair ATPase RecN